MPDAHLTERLRELASQAASQGFVTHTRFLTPAERLEAAAWLKKSRTAHAFSGGYADAERQACFLLPEYLAESGLPDEEVADAFRALRLQGSPRAASPSHRDYLGSLLGLGIRRDQLGDILVGEHGATAIVLAPMAAFISSQLERVGSAAVTVEPVALTDIVPAARQFTELRITVASLRLDKVAASGFGIPRTEMAELIESGAVQLNWLETQRPDQPVPVGAVISLRGHGRIRLVREEGLSRKDRHILVLERYL